IPHRSTKDMIYNNYFIPKGSIILPRVWYHIFHPSQNPPVELTHDPTIYHSAMTFKPKRFTQTEPERDPCQFMLGFGRRICAGRHLADVSIFLAL
ncbi:hypothetical protein K435DRAFT_671823, partial [Dendrothele bispora CBS 962.96]